ncbi:hypothetical protein [Mesorhizobium sp.]|uniref:hypothetical protein n=1 Tax=Mesorhizobium sp. TaxID=1871066 RepID=UPI000FE8269F|nr:hypothetical protein [Mesorhizobium sp.]RWF33746.1 MAG: hypothetical protein EOS45_02110 [Mesorhizobium sp.]
MTQSNLLTAAKFARALSDAPTINFERENRNMHFILDCDGVLLDWTRGFRHWVHANHGIKPSASGPRSWSLFNWLGLPEERCFELITEFNASQAFGELYAQGDAPEAMAKLKAAGHKLTVLTSCSDDPVALQRRKQNLDREFAGIFDRVICLALRESKAKWLEVLERGIWIEDNYKNAMIGSDAGHTTFMLRHLHNAEDEKSASNRSITWVDNFAPIVSLFS